MLRWRYNSLSNAVFGFALATIVPETMEVFRRDFRQSQKTQIVYAFLAPVGDNFYQIEKLTEIVL